QQAYIIVDETKKLIKMNNLTLQELTHQSLSCMNLQSFKKMQQENFTFELADMKDNIINSDEAVQQSFAMDEPSFKILWKLIVNGKYKTIKNAVVVMITISEYIDNTKWPNIPNLKKKNARNYQQIFREELNYQFMSNKHPKMQKRSVQSFLAKFAAKYKLHDSSHEYDGLIIIICGHGENGNMLVASDGKSLSIDEIYESLGCDILESFKGLPKIFIIDLHRGENTSAINTTTMRGKTEEKKDMKLHGDNYNEFLFIWLTTQRYEIADFSLLSKCMKSVIISKYKSGYPFKQMLDDVRQEIRKSKNGEWYCMETQDTASYDMVFASRKKS
ncbi:hypothetical protein RFI_34937, partial [Reticulomyxa filosa]